MFFLLYLIVFIPIVKITHTSNVILLSVAQLYPKIPHQSKKETGYEECSAGTGEIHCRSNQS